MRIKNWAIGLLMVFFGLISTGCASNTSVQTQTTAISQVIAFGDSYTDNGASQKISQAIANLPNKPADAVLLPADPVLELYWGGRWTDGPTAVEVLADGLHAKLTDYAVGGAKSGTDNYYEWINKVQDTGVLGQIKEFEKDLKGKKADTDALYFIFIGANDYFQHTDNQLPGSITALANQTVQNIDTAVTELAKIGAHHFMVVNSTDLAVVPWEIANNLTKEAHEFSDSVNQDLVKDIPSLAEKLQVKILLFDHTAISNKIRANPNTYGLKEINLPYELTYPKVKKSDGNPDEYYFWDEWHPTRVVHRIVGNEMLQQLKN